LKVGCAAGLWNWEYLNSCAFEAGIHRYNLNAGSNYWRSMEKETLSTMEDQFLRLRKQDKGGRT